MAISYAKWRCSRTRAIHVVSRRQSWWRAIARARLSANDAMLRRASWHLRTPRSEGAKEMRIFTLCIIILIFAVG